MKRLFSLVSLCLLCLLPCPAAQAEGVTLSSAEGGYSITLPEFWTQMAPEILARSTLFILEIMPEQAAPSLRATRQGAAFRAPDYSSLASLTIQHVSHADMGVTGADLADIAAPGNPTAEKLRKRIEQTLEKADLTITTADNPPDGLAVAMELQTAGVRAKYPGPKLYGIVQARFTVDNVIIISANLMAQDALDRKKEVQKLLDALIIAPEKLLSPRPPQAENKE